MGEIRVGTSGWNYPSGKGTWNGVFYPKSRSKRAGTDQFDELRFYAEHFNTVEVNTTFYGQPRAEVTRAWADRTSAGFDFSLKLYQKFTHPKMFREAALKSAPGSEGALLDLLAQVTSPQARDYLSQLLRAFSDYPLAVELRHSSWSDAIGETLPLLNAFGAAWVQIDEPKFRFSIRQNYLPNVTSFYYMRLHGRNAAQWWKHDKSEDRYNYLYTAGELQELSETANAAKALVKKSYLYTNNHFSSKSVVNAVMLKAQLGQPIEGEYPDALVEEYPELASLIPESSRARFDLSPVASAPRPSRK